MEVTYRQTNFEIYRTSAIENWSFLQEICTRKLTKVVPNIILRIILLIDNSIISCGH
jgi:hypothetical protein